jgi:hypothetical protein
MVLLAVAASAHFVFQTAVVPQVADPSLVFGGAVSSALLLLLIGDRPRRADLQALGGQRVALALGAGVLGLVLAPALVVVNRYSDAPPGTVVVVLDDRRMGFASCRGFSDRTRRPTRAAGGLVAVVGCMGIVGSWERPSSFSLLVRYPFEEMSFVVAGIAWAAFAVIIGGLARAYGTRAVYAFAAAGGLAGSLVMGLARIGVGRGHSGSACQSPAGSCSRRTCRGAHGASVATGWISSAGHRPASAPALITGLLVVEQATGVFGPRPILLDQAVWGAVLTAAQSPLPSCGTPMRALRRRAVLTVGVVLAAGSVAAALSSR